MCNYGNNDFIKLTYYILKTHLFIVLSSIIIGNSPSNFPPDF